MSALADSARTMIGKPFRHRGRGPNFFDCAGHVREAFKRAGTFLKDFTLYGREPHKDGLVLRTEEALGPPVAGPPMDGDVVLIAYCKEPHHMAVVGQKNYGGLLALTLIHADGTVGRVLEQRLTPDVKITHVFRRPV